MLLPVFSLFQPIEAYDVVCTFVWVATLCGRVVLHFATLYAVRLVLGVSGYRFRPVCEYFSIACCCFLLRVILFCLLPDDVLVLGLLA